MTHTMIRGSMMAPKNKRKRRRPNMRRRYRFQSPIVLRARTGKRGRTRRRPSFDKRHPRIAEAKRAAQGVARLAGKVRRSTSSSYSRTAARIEKWGTTTIATVPPLPRPTPTAAVGKRVTPAKRPQAAARAEKARSEAIYTKGRDGKFTGSRSVTAGAPKTATGKRTTPAKKTTTRK